MEFLVFGVIMGITEDIIAVKVATGASITMHTVVVITIVAIPFAIIGELLVDSMNRHPVKKRK